MDPTALLLSRFQFAFTISFHIIFPAFTIGLAAWLTVLEAMHMYKGKNVYGLLFEFWLKVLGVAFGIGVVSGVVMAFQFGTNWSVLSRMPGPVQGPLLSYTAFALEAGFFGILIFARPRVPPWFYLSSTAMVALGTALSAFWIMVNNSWMQVPVGYVLQDAQFVPDDWSKIIFNRVVWTRFPHMLLASYLTGAFCVAAAGAWYLLRQFHRSESLVMLRMGLALAATLLPAQLYVGHLVGDYVHDYQPAKFAAIEGRWHDQQPASEVLIAIPNAETESSRYEVAIPVFGRKSEPDLKGGRHNQLLAAGRPPVAITFFTFRIMVGCGIIMLAVSWLGLTLSIRHALEQSGRAPVVHISQLSPALDCHHNRLVHG